MQLIFFKLPEHSEGIEMLGKAVTFSRIGMRCENIVVEADVKRGLPAILFTGMLSQEARESKERIRPAIVNSGFDFPMKRITVNFSPAETHKTGTHYDLAVATAVLKSEKKIKISDDSVFFGELNLSGEIKWVRGILPLVNEAINQGYKKIYVPFENLSELSKINSEYIFPLEKLSDITLSEQKHEFVKYEESGAKCEQPSFEDVKGQDDLVNAFFAAAAGHHHLLIIGPPGTGKTMCASRLPGIMPELTSEELLEVNMIYSIASEFSGGKWINHRPFRFPHNSSSTRAMIGGGPKLLPGEVSLSHKGILFLDEFLEFHSDALQSLRTIIEKKEVRISLRNGYTVYPADFLLIAAANPCPCGLYETDGGICSCSESEVKKYRKKLNNPLSDRIDIQIKAGRVNFDDLYFTHNNKFSSKDLKYKIEEVRRIQANRYENEYFKVNSAIPPEKMRTFCRTSSMAENILEELSDDYLLSARSIHKIIRIARTIADIKNNEVIDEDNILDAFSLRFLDVERTGSRRKERHGEIDTFT